MKFKVLIKLLKADSIIVYIIAIIFAAGSVQAQTSVKSECFNFDSFSPEIRLKAEEYLLKALDTEHLFTLVSGLKPMSGGFYGKQVSVSIPMMSESEARQIIAEIGAKTEEDRSQAERSRLTQAENVTKRIDSLKEIDDLRMILTKWRCGDEIYADVIHFASPYANDRSLQGVVFSLPSLKRMVTEKNRFFSRWAITPNSSPIEVLMAVEYSRDTSRFAGYGYLFGYPDEAVKFFTDASIHQDMTGDFVVRDFRAIPTFQRDTGQFTYAVAKGAEETDIDRNLKARAAIILEAYKKRRAEYIGDGKPGAAAMLRDWFCPTDNNCSPQNALKH